MPYLLDANTVIEMLNDGGSPAARRVRRERAGNIVISSIVAHELYYGAFKSRRAPENVGRIDAFRFATADFDQEDARQAGTLRAMLAREGQSIGPYDVLIAGQALRRGLTLVTHNIREFSRIPDLRIEDWHV